MITFLRSVIADLEKQNASGADVVSEGRKSASGERRKTRAARPVVKRATRRRRAARRAPAQRHARRSVRVHHARRSSL
jgi:hypothetical protein